MTRQPVTHTCRKCGNELTIQLAGRPEAQSFHLDVQRSAVCPSCGQPIIVTARLSTGDIEAYRRAAAIHQRARSDGDEQRALQAELGERPLTAEPARPVGYHSTLRAVRGLLVLATGYIDGLLEGQR